jgi:hypothetical protein
MTIAPQMRADLLTAIRIAEKAHAARDRAALEQLLYSTWFARAGPAARMAWTNPNGAWWSAAGSAGPPPPAMVRIYWNCPPHAASVLLAAIIAALEGLQLPFSLKCPLAEAMFDRADPVVLYIGFAEWEAAKTALRGVHSALSKALRPSVPPLTLRLGPGVAAAEDPADGRSFGQSRAAAVADGLAHAAERGIADDEVRLALLVERLAVHDISPEWPYLRASSRTDLLTTW